MSDLGSTPETSTRRNDTGRRARARSTDSALLTLGARSPSRPHSPAAVGDGRASRAPVEQLQRWGTSGEIREVAPGETLGELMHRERPTPETTAHMARLQQHNATHERSVGDSGSIVGMRSPSRGSPSTRSQGGVDPAGCPCNRKHGRKRRPARQLPARPQKSRRRRDPREHHLLPRRAQQSRTPFARCPQDRRSTAWTTC